MEQVKNRTIFVEIILTKLKNDYYEKTTLLTFMKKTPLLAIVLTAIIVVLIMFLTPLAFGYNHAYIGECNFDLENMYYVWATIGSLATLSAIIVAVWIPKKIGKKQNDIALFDKRYGIYREFEKLKYFRTLIGVKPPPSMGGDTEQRRRDMDKSSFVSSKGIPISEVEKLSNGDLFLRFDKEVKKTIEKLKEIDLFFDIDKEIDGLCEKYESFVWDMQMTPSKYVESRKEFLECFDAFGINDFIATLKKQLKP